MSSGDTPNVSNSCPLQTVPKSKTIYASDETQKNMQQQKEKKCSCSSSNSPRSRAAKYLQQQLLLQLLFQQHCCSLDSTRAVCIEAQHRLSASVLLVGCCKSPASCCSSNCSCCSSMPLSAVRLSSAADGSCSSSSKHTPQPHIYRSLYTANMNITRKVGKEERRRRQRENGDNKARLV